MAGQSQREIRRRIRSVRSTQHITRAMQVVSAAKLRRVQGQKEAVALFARKLEEVLERLVGAAGKHPLLQKRELGSVSYLVLSADHGLAGGYNLKVTDWAVEVLRQEKHPYDLHVVGRKATEDFRARGLSIAAEYAGIGDDVDWHDTCQLAEQLRQSFLTGETDAVYVVFTESVNVMAYRPTVRQLIPVESLPGGSSAKESTEMIFEPSPAEVLDVLLPRHMDTSLYLALLEAKISEHGARTVAMRQATDNAEEMIETLTLSLNQARQAGITKEISEIVGGANAQVGMTH